jgi:hypothetical protein
MTPLASAHLQVSHAGGDATQLHAALQELCAPHMPPYVILSCDAWPQLVAILPPLLLAAPSSGAAAGVAAAAQQLLLQQLAPELLHRSPEPLAQLLLALLQHAAAGSDDTAAASRAHAFPSAVLQVVVAGLQLLGRQWHFLEQPLAEQLCSALVATMQQPLAKLQQAQCHEQPQQQRGHEPLALQLLLCEPRCSWWHRLNANSASSRPLRAAAEQQGLVQQLLRWAREQGQQQQGGSSSAQPSAATRDAMCGSQLLSHCLAVLLLAACVGAHSGRQQLQQTARGGEQALSSEAPGLPAAVCCLRAWAASHVSSVPELPAAAAQLSIARDAYVPGPPAPAPAASAARPTELAGAGSGASVACVVAAAAEGACLALQAYEEQRLWFEA